MTTFLKIYDDKISPCRDIDYLQYCARELAVAADFYVSVTNLLRYSLIWQFAMWMIWG